MKIQMMRMVPFLTREELGELLGKIQESPTGVFEGVSLCAVAPFLDQETVNAVFLAELDKVGSYVSLAPFVSDALWSGVVDKYMNGNHAIDLVPLYPFMDAKTFTDLFRKACEGTVEGLDLGPMLPFIDETALDELFHARLKDGKDVAMFLPFVSDATMHRMAEDFCAGGSAIDIDAFYPFMSEDDIRMIFRHAMDGARQPEPQK